MAFVFGDGESGMGVVDGVDGCGEVGELFADPGDILGCEARDYEGAGVGRAWRLGRAGGEDGEGVGVYCGRDWGVENAFRRIERRVE